MGTKVQCESLIPGYHQSMRDLNNESNGCRWPLFYSDNKTSASDQCYNGGGFPSQSQTTFGFDKDAVRKTMLEHEAIFKSQVSELHRVYRIQKDMMDELKRKQLNKEWVPMEASFSSQATTTNDDFRKWKIPSAYDRPSTSVVEDNGHSPMKASNSRGPVPWQNNGASSKNVETRPTKIRKKMIDLCLPADDYIDDSDEVVELKDHRPSQLPNGFVKTESRGDSLRIGYGGFSNRSNGLADLNEPIKAQETNEFDYGHSRGLRNGDFQGNIRSQALNSHVPRHPDENGKQVWPHQPLRIDHYSGANKSATPFLQPGKPMDSSSQSMQVLMNNSSQRVNPGSQSKSVLWRERTFIDLEADTDTNTSHESSLASHHQQPRHFYPDSSSVPWNHLQSSWQNPSFGFPQKLPSSVQRYPVLNLSDTLSGGNAQKQGCIGDRLQFESNSRFNNSGFGNTVRSDHNMFYSECSSSSKPKSKFTGTPGYNYGNGGRSDYSAANPLMDSNGSEMKFVRDLNLNVTLSNTCEVEVRKSEEQHQATLPWLMKPKPACNSEMGNRKWNLNTIDDAPYSSSKPLDIKDDAGNKVQDLAWLESLHSNKPDTEKIDANKKVPGFGYRDQSNAEKGKVNNGRMMLDMNEPCDPEDQETEEQMGTKVSASNNRCQFDLNMSISDDEDEKVNCSVPTSSRLNSKVLMIDLEAPAPESDDEDIVIPREKLSEETPIEETLTEKPPEFEKIAAETILAISSACLDRELEVVASSSEASETVILHWFADTVDTHRENLDKKLDALLRKQTRSIENIDYLESMTLQLPEITEDEYMPKPLVPEDLRFEETSGTGMVTSQRPRRGNARKGKQRRDFQRDILPGLLSLSKHEVTEDIQMFDGFMRATGSSWTPTGLARKKTGSRGRPRRVITIPEPVYCPGPPLPLPPPPPPPPPSVQQHWSNESNNNGEIEMGIEDRSFAGWGKMTRRPRRQRCPSTAAATSSNQRPSSHAPFT